MKCYKMDISEMIMNLKEIVTIVYIESQVYVTQDVFSHCKNF